MLFPKIQDFRHTFRNNNWKYKSGSLKFIVLGNIIISRVILKKIKISGINLITSENILVIGNEKQIKEDIIIWKVN
jgi:hypothetical protein